MNGIANGARTRLHPAFGHGTGLDHLVWTFLDVHAPRSIADVAKLTGYTRPTVRRKLRALEGHGLARSGANGDWLQVGDLTTLDAIATALHRDQRTTKRLAQHRRDRATHQRTAPPPPRPETTP